MTVEEKELWKTYFRAPKGDDNFKADVFKLAERKSLSVNATIRTLLVADMRAEGIR